ncbi:hypothetical protein BH11PSE4_BH11PSE4_14900 [soil metagenome]
MNLSTRLGIAMTALVLGTAAAGLIGYHSVESSVVPAALVRLDTQARARLGVLDIYLSGFRSDVLGMRAVPSHDGLVRSILAGGHDPQGGTSEEVWRQRIEGVYLAQLKTKPAIQQFRLIGIADGGREIVRVDRSGVDGAPRIVPPQELEQKGDRGYFRDSITLAPDQAYISPIGLNQERGVLEVPHRPVMRFAASLRDEAGKPFGIVIINLDLRPIFERMRAAMDEDSLIYLFNADGDFLLHPDPGHAFGFDLGRRHRWQDELPGLVKAVGSAGRGAAVIADSDGQQVAAALATAQVADGPWLGIIETDSYAALMAPAAAARRSDLIVASAAVLFAVVLAVLLARSMTRPLIAITRAVDSFAGGGPMTVPPGLTGEVGILAAAFSRMAERLNEKAEALRHKSDMLDKTVDSMADAVLMIDAQGETMFANPVCMAMFGGVPHLASEEWHKAHPRFCKDGVTPMPAHEAPFGRFLRGENFDDVEISFRPVDEAELTRLVASGRIIRDEAGTVEGAVIVYHDVTGLRETERQLHQAQKMEAVGQLTGGVAHDFNNILTVINGGIEMIGEGVADRPHLSELAQMVNEAAHRGADLTHRLLSFARRQPLQPSAVDVNNLVLDALRLLRPTLGGHIEIDTRLVPEPWLALADPVQLSNALVNLAINARDAMPSGGKLTFATSNVPVDDGYAAQNIELAPGAYVLVAVSDNGCGMPASVRDRVFEPFFTTKPVGKGTGLGLSMVYGFVRQSGGLVKIYSEEGIGTTMKLYLPRAVDVSNAVADTPIVDIVGGHETVLVVEDDELVRQYVMTNLAALGYAAVAASGAPEALALAADSPPFDLLLTDVILGAGINGRELADKLEQRQPSLRVLYTSGYSEDALVHHGRLDAGLRLLTKPYRRADLARMIRQVLDEDVAAQV